MFIYPQGSDYACRRFGCRISSATVEQAHSTFTPLPGIDRIILPLDGQLELTHQPGERIVLAPLEPYCFSGDMPTQSLGAVKDFNVMTSQGFGADLDTITALGRPVTKEIACDAATLFFFVYCHAGTLSAGSAHAKPGESLVIFRDDRTVPVTVPDNGAAIVVRVFKP